jgi:hypothetical protein
VRQRGAQHSRRHAKEGGRQRALYLLPLLGNAVSFGVGIYDAAGAYSTYQRCMAGTN